MSFSACLKTKLLRFGLLLGLLPGLLPGLWPCGSLAQSAPGLDAVTPSEPIETLLKGLILRELPHHYRDMREWGKQTEVYDGFQFRRDRGGRWETQRQWKSVNDGTWRQFSIELLDPQRTFQVELGEVRSESPGVAKVELAFVSEFRWQARQAEWWRGIQLYSFSAEGSARVGLHLNVSVSSQLDWKSQPPEIAFHPKVLAAKLEILDFKMDRVSKLGGEVAQQATTLVRDPLDRMVREKSVELADRLNRHLADHRDELRLELGAAARLPWLNRAHGLLPADVHQPIDPGQPGKD